MRELCTDFHQAPEGREHGSELLQLSEKRGLDQSPTDKPLFSRAAPFLRRGLALMLVLFLTGWLLRKFGPDTWLDTQWIDTWVRGNGVTGVALFVFVGTVFTALGLPRQIFSFLAGYAFGFMVGTEFALVATLLGAAIAFHSARLVGRAFLIQHFPRHIKKIDDLMTDRTMSMTLLLRLSPVSNNLATNVAGGVSEVRVLPFFAASALGYLPQTLVFTLLGSGFHLDPRLRTGLSIALFVISTLLGTWLWYYHRRGVARRGKDNERTD